MTTIDINVDDDTAAALVGIALEATLTGGPVDISPQLIDTNPGVLIASAAAVITSLADALAEADGSTRADVLETWRWNIAMNPE